MGPGVEVTSRRRRTWEARREGGMARHSDDEARAREEAKGPGGGGRLRGGCGGRQRCRRGGVLAAELHGKRSYAQRTTRRLTGPRVRHAEEAAARLWSMAGGGDEDPGKDIDIRGMVLVAGEGGADAGSPACGVAREEEGDLEEKVGAAGRSKKEEGGSSKSSWLDACVECGGAQGTEGEGVERG